MSRLLCNFCLIWVGLLCLANNYSHEASNLIFFLSISISIPKGLYIKQKYWILNIPSYFHQKYLWSRRGVGDKHMPCKPGVARWIPGFSIKPISVGLWVLQTKKKHTNQKPTWRYWLLPREATNEIFLFYFKYVVCSSHDWGFQYLMLPCQKLWKQVFSRLQVKCLYTIINTLCTNGFFLLVWQINFGWSIVYIKYQVYMQVIIPK